jgi:CubicO group peptidase (beta-lactamase class C family)
MGKDLGVGRIGAAVDAIAERALRGTGTPGAVVAVVTADGAAYVRGYGVREHGKDAPVTPRTLFPMASTTKAVTAAGAALLVGEGRLRWDDRVAKHLPEFRLSDPLADAAVTLRDLLCHRTGMPRHDMLWFRTGRGRAEVVRRFAHAAPNTGFRERYQYNNIGYLAAGEACARAAGHADYDDFVRARLTGPLGMTGVVSRFPEQEAHSERASGHRVTPPAGRRRRPTVVPQPWRDYDNVGGAGCLCGTGEDFAAWLRFQLSGGLAPDGSRLVDAAALRETHTPQVVEPAMDEEGRRLYPETTQRAYAMGWSVFDYRGGHRVLSHAGAQNGFRHRSALAPDAGVGVFVAVSALTFAPEVVRNGVLDLLLGLPERDWLGAYNELQAKAAARAAQRPKADAAKRHKGTRPSRAAGAYAGTYEHAAYGAVTVTEDAARLRLGCANFEPAPLTHRHYDTFRTDGGDPAFEATEVRFALGPDGEVATLTMFGAEFRRTAAG